MMRERGKGKARPQRKQSESRQQVRHRGREMEEWGHTNTCKGFSPGVKRKETGKTEIFEGEKRKVDTFKRVTSLPDETIPRVKQSPNGVNARIEHL